MALTFEVDEVRVSPGEAARFPFVLRNDATQDVTYSFQLRHGDGVNPGRWHVEGGPVLRVRQVAHSWLELEVPGQGTPAGEYRIWLTAIPDEGSASTAVCVLVVESRSRIKILGLPRVRLNPDGSITVSLSIVDDGDSGLDFSVEVRHRDGWAFEIGQPQLHLGTHVGPFQVDVTVHPPAGKSAQPGDEVTVDLGYGGQTLATATVRIPIGAPGRSPAPPSLAIGRFPKRRGLAWLLGGALLAFGLAGAIGYRASRQSPQPPPPPVSPTPPVSPSTPASLSLMVQESGAGVVTSEPGGIRCPPSCSGSFPGGRRVTLVATPSRGSIFSGWVGAPCAGTGACTLMMSGDQTVRAPFVAGHILTVSVEQGASVSIAITGSSSSTSCAGGPTCPVPVPDGAQVTLTATPPSPTGSFNPVWIGCPSLRGFSCTLVMGADQSVQFSYQAVVR